MKLRNGVLSVNEYNPAAESWYLALYAVRNLFYN